MISLFFVIIYVQWIKGNLHTHGKITFIQQYKIWPSILESDLSTASSFVMKRSCCLSVLHCCCLINCYKILFLFVILSITLFIFIFDRF
jgi:hypothetical protein